VEPQAGHAAAGAQAAQQSPVAGAQSELAEPPASQPLNPFPTASGGSPIPAFLVPIYRSCGAKYGIPWRILAAINEVETAFGANLNVSSAGAVGWMQFLPSTWSAYGVDADGDGRRDPYDPKDAICAAARYLRASGARHDLPGAIFAYNHAEWYVDLVLGLARGYRSYPLPRPLPRAARLDRRFAERLARISRASDVDWALVLAVVRVRGAEGRSPVGPRRLRAVAARAARAERRAGSRRLGPAVRELFAKRRTGLRVAAATRYAHAVGLRGLSDGLSAIASRLERRVLDSGRLEIYPGGRDDVATGRIDPRVLTLLLYLAERYDGITVTSLVTGHDYFARPGVPSMHAFGRAVDIAAIRGRPVLGNQQPGGITERVLRDILLLPGGLRPDQLISLFDLGGPSFAAADHADHIHAGY
jgi:membrane-bound lytic murein transglycosylase B